uniref:ARAD1C44308p n=1 Tax=Blastobotrys adeninivorans TaxID=409370 RepID=A0A060T3Z4_BLAAD
MAAGKMLKLVLFLGLAEAQRFIFKQPGSQIACDPSQLGIQDFSGFRIQHQAALSPPLEHHTRITRCVQGSPLQADAYAPLSINYHYTHNDSDIAWRKKICTLEIGTVNNCYILARRRRYALRNISAFAPGTWVGGLYWCPDTESPIDGVECGVNAIPVSALVADTPWNAWYEIPDTRHYTQRIPLLATTGQVNDFVYAPPPPENWADNWDELNPLEDYSYSDAEVNLAAQWHANVTNWLSSAIPGVAYDAAARTSAAPLGVRRRHTYAMANGSVQHTIVSNWDSPPGFQLSGPSLTGYFVLLLSHLSPGRGLQVLQQFL